MNAPEQGMLSSAAAIQQLQQSQAAAKLPTGAQLATAFDGPLSPLRTTLAYRFAALLVLLAMLLLPVVYVGIIAAAVAGVMWYAQHATAMFSAIPPGRAWLLVAVIYVAPLIAGALLVVFMILPLCWRTKKRERPLWVDRKEQPLLFAYVNKLCDTMGAPRPVRIDVTAEANASAHIDNGMFGLVNRQLVLTLGLPIARAMDLQQFTGVVAHELGHFAQGGSMRISYAVYRINLWFFRLAYTRSRVDDVLNSIIGNETHWTIGLIGGLSKMVLWLTRLLLRGLATASHGLSMHLSRHAEFDADRQAARIVGSEVLAESLQATPFLGAAGSMALTRAKAGWAKRSLPDDLVVMTHFFNGEMPDAVKDKITATLLTADARWFDTHPPLFQRVGALKKAGTKGVLKLKAPATCLFRDFDELCKLATIRMYQTALGDKLQPEHLVPTDVSVLKSAKKPMRAPVNGAVRE
jgi:Zn-dependent protease with chaperone function